MTVLQIQDLSAGYGTKTVLRGMNLAIGAGEFVSVIAPNGAGKSTLLKTAAGLLPPLSGSVRLHERQLASYSRRELARQVAMVSSDITAHDYTVYQMTLLGRFAHMNRFAGPSAEDRWMVDKALHDVGLWQQRSCLCSELSQGERQKVLLARALAQAPVLLLLDEPTAHLDVGNQFAIMELIKQLADNKGLAVMAVLHDINLALGYATRLLLLNNGGILAYGSPIEAATPDNLKSLYGMDFTFFCHAAATYVQPSIPPERQQIKAINGGS